MQFGRAFHQLKINPELVVQGIGVITHDIQAAAFERPFRSEGGDDDMTAWFYGSRHLPDIGGPLLRFGEEMEYRAIVPHVVAMLRQIDLGDIGCQPCHVVCVLSLIHISEPTRRTPISYAVFCLKKKKK